MLYFLVVAGLTCASFAHPFVKSAPALTSDLPTYKRGFDIPIQRRVDGRKHKRGEVSGSIGLGNNADLLYTVPIELGDSVAAVNIDTGSSDLWVVSDTCQADTCKGSTVSRYPSSPINDTGADVFLLYGDSTTGTFASGPVGLEIATIAGVAMTGQAFGVINATNNAIVQFDSAGIFGLGFPSGSKVQEALVTTKYGPIDDTDDFLHATYIDGPLLTRIAMTGELEMPMFSITLQRSTIDIGGSGMLTIGKLPDGIDNSSLTWVPVRLYGVEDGGLRPPTFAPDEVYPFRWEIDIDGVFLDGQKVADSTIPAAGVNPGRVTALIDTGNSILRGPADVVDSILKTVSPSYDPTDSNSTPTLPCSIPRTLSFQIGGKMFPVDPRDFIGPLEDGDTTTCIADNLVATDAPRSGSLYRWSLGDTFMKSNLIAFHYGNITHPSVDPPRIGFLSTVPANADDLLKQAVIDAQNNGGNFEETLVVAPTASAAADGQLTVFPGPLRSSSTSGTITRTATATSDERTATTSSSNENLNESNAAFAIDIPTSRCETWVYLTLLLATIILL